MGLRRGVEAWVEEAVEVVEGGGVLGGWKPTKASSSSLNTA